MWLAAAGCGFAGGLVVWAGDRGWLGWRLRAWRWSVGFGVAVALLGPPLLGFAAAGVKAVGVKEFAMSCAMVSVLVGAGYRWLWWRSRVAARVAVGAAAVAVVAPSLLVGVVGPWLGVLIPAGLLFGWYRLSR